MTNLSINMITYNGLGAFIKEAIAAVRPFSQDIIIYDTGSTDGTWDYLQSIKDKEIRVFREDTSLLGERDLGNKSPCARRITGILNEMKVMSKNEWILRIDDDEIFTHQVMREILDMEKESVVYSIPFHHVGTSSGMWRIKRFFKNIPEITWDGAYGQGVGETLTFNHKRLSSNKCPSTKHFFFHLGGLRKNFSERLHDYSQWN